MSLKERNIATEIGALLRQVRVDNGLSQEELSFKCGLHRTYIGSIERGEKVPSIATLEKITTSLDISLSELFKKYEKAKVKK